MSYQPEDQQTDYAALCAHYDAIHDASNPQEQASTTAKTLTQEEIEERREDCCRWFDDKEQAYNDTWSLREEGSNDGEGESYSARNL